MNSTLTMASVYLAVWLIFFFALTDSLTVRNGNPDRANGLTEDTVVISTINTVQLFQLGLLSVIPLWGELCLETGFLEVCRPAAALPYHFIVLCSAVIYERWRRRGPWRLRGR